MGNKEQVMELLQVMNEIIESMIDNDCIGEAKHMWQLGKVIDAIIEIDPRLEILFTNEYNI